MDAFLADDTLTGQAVELSLDKIYFREQHDYPNESQKWIGEESNKIWDEGYAVGTAPLKRNGY
jgi:15-hydroxyprostaglandin dehydrogenase (NAD)